MNENITYITASIVFCVLGFIILVSATIRERNKKRISRQKGLLWLRALRMLLSSIQQHRGLTTGYLNGSKELLENITPLQQKIKRQIEDVAVIGNWMTSNSQWISITDHWTRLHRNYSINTVENNLQQHNQLINNILELIDDMAVAHYLLHMKSVQQPPQLLWRNLLTTAELIGQTRAVGMGVTSRSQCDSIARIKLNYLCQKIDLKIKDFWQQLPPSTEQKSRIENFLCCINEHVVLETPTITAADFFATASAVIDNLHLQFDQLIAQYFKEHNIRMV